VYIMILRPGAIGDTLLTFPVIASLRKRYAPAHLTLIGNATTLPLAQASGLVDEVFDYQEPRWSHLFLPPNSRVYPDTIFDRVTRRSQLAICWLRDPEGNVERHLLSVGIQHVIVTPGHPDNAAKTHIHITDFLAQSIGLPPLGTLQTLTIPLPALAPVMRLPRLVILHPGSGGKNKCWPLERFATVADWLCQQQYTLLVLTGPAEEEQELLQRLFPRPCIFLADAPLLTIAQHIQQCQCYIGNDSGLTHLAAMLGCPTLALFGPTSNPTLWHPPGPSVTIVHTLILAQLSSETIITQLQSILP
jgi:heptosyltransferase III